MKAAIKYIKNLKISTKFILWFLLISSIPLAVAIYISYDISRKILKKQIENNLAVIADERAGQIEALLEAKKNDAVIFFYTSELVNALEGLVSAFGKGGVASAEYVSLRQRFKPMISYYQKLFGYNDVFLIGPDGDIVFSMQDEKIGNSLYQAALSGDSELAGVFIKAKDLKEMQVSNFEYEPKVKRASVFIAMPVFKAAEIVGVAAVRLDNSIFDRLVFNYSGLGNTGETIIVSKIKEDAVFINPLRFDPEAVFTRKITIGSTEFIGLQKALQGENGIGVLIDYRNKETLSVWRYLPTFGLGMVVKMDTAEIFASAEQLRGALFLATLVLLSLVIIAAFIIARSISGPISALTMTSKTISSGDFSARAKVEARDEIGELASSFNLMTDKLVEAKLNIEEKNAELEEQKVLLEKTNKELDSFVYTVSHDLRAPLRGIDGFANFLEQDYSAKLDAAGKDYLSRIRLGSASMQRLIDDLLKLSRISRIMNPYEDVRIKELLDSVLGRLEFDIKKNKVDLKISGELPVVRCDRIKIEEAFLNLINNAIKFSSKNKDKDPYIEIGYNDRESAHEFYVKDNGIGIDKQHHEKVFEIFQRLHRQEEYEGTGAGLSIVKKIIDDHGGAVWIDSETGKGATFFFTIPKGIRQEPAASNEAAAQGQGPQV